MTKDEKGQVRKGTASTFGDSKHLRWPTTTHTQADRSIAMTAAGGQFPDTGGNAQALAAHNLAGY